MRRAFETVAIDRLDRIGKTRSLFPAFSFNLMPELYAFVCCISVRSFIAPQSSTIVLHEVYTVMVRTIGTLGKSEQECGEKKNLLFIFHLKKS